jgi:hypothetical protein
LPIFATIRKHGGLTAGIGFLHPVTDRVTLSAHGCVTHSWSRRVSSTSLASDTLQSTAPYTAVQNGTQPKDTLSTSHSTAVQNGVQPKKDRRRHSANTPETVPVAPAGLLSLRSASAGALSLRSASAGALSLGSASAGAVSLRSASTGALSLRSASACPLVVVESGRKNAVCHPPPRHVAGFCTLPRVGERRAACSACLPLLINPLFPGSLNPRPLLPALMFVY